VPLDDVSAVELAAAFTVSPNAPDALPAKFASPL
jgi:hypothetical protein